MWLLYVGISVLFFSLLSLMQRIVAVKSGHFRASALAFNAVSILFAVLLSAVTGGLTQIHFPSSPYAYIFVVIAVICYGLFERLRFRAARGVEASENAILGNFATVVAFILSVILYREGLTPFRIFGVLLVLAALILASWQPNIKLTGKNTLIVLLAEGLLGIATALDKMGAQYFTAGFYNILVWVFPFAIIAFPRFPWKEVRQEFRAQSKYLWIMAFLNVIGYFTMLKAYLTADAVQVLPVIQTSSLLTVILAVFILKERDHLPRKVLAAVLALSGVFLLSAR